MKNKERVVLLTDQYEKYTTHILIFKEPVSNRKIGDVIESALTKRQEFEKETGLDPDSDSLWIEEELKNTFKDKVKIINTFDTLPW